MNEKKIKESSKFMSLVLRHEPHKIGLTLDNNGWASVEILLQQMAKFGIILLPNELEMIVNTNDKQRFAFNEDKSQIRANQGHSVDIDLDLQPVEPPVFLYHGTVAKFINTIQLKGLQKMSRQHVHLSKDLETAIKVGNRRGNAIILTISTGKMHKDGYKFYCSSNGIWLTDHVPTKYIEFK